MRGSLGLVNICCGSPSCAAQEHIGTEEHGPLLSEVHELTSTRSGSEVPCLIKLVVVGDMRLGDERQHLTAAKGHRTVVKLPTHPPGHTDEDECIERRGPISKVVEPTLGRVEQGVLPKEVLAGIAGDAELRQYHDLGTVRTCVAHCLTLKATSATRT